MNKERSEILSIIKIHQIRHRELKSKYKSIISYVMTLTPPKDKIAAYTFWKAEKIKILHLLDNLNLTSG